MSDPYTIIYDCAAARVRQARRNGVVPPLLAMVSGPQFDLAGLRVMETNYVTVDGERVMLMRNGATVEPVHVVIAPSDWHVFAQPVENQNAN